MKNTIELMRYTRNHISALVADLTIVQLNYIPKGFNNNIIWNLGHIIYTQQSMCYRLGGLTPKINMDHFRAFTSGTFPEVDRTAEEAAMIRQLLLTVPDDLEADLDNGLFAAYEPWSLHDQLIVHDIQDAMAVTAVHEGRHFGVISMLKRLVIN